MPPEAFSTPHPPCEPDDLGPDEVRPSEARPRLNRERVLAAALALADDRGLESLSMRRLGQALGVEAMSLYRHVANKDAILDALVEEVFAEIALPLDGEPWRAALGRRARSALQVLQAHPWTIALLESRGRSGPAALRYYDSILGCLRAQGFTLELAAHAFATLDSYVYGFALQHVEPQLERDSRARMQPREDLGKQSQTPFPEGEFDHVRELLAIRAPWREGRLNQEFEWGLELLLEGLERRLSDLPRS